VVLVFAGGGFVFRWGIYKVGIVVFKFRVLWFILVCRGLLYFDLFFRIFNIICW